jgi:hypothetical protein
MAPQRRAVLLAAVLPTLAAGCALMVKLGLVERPAAFSHRTHAREQLECQSCHASYETSERAGMPKLQQCLLCHEGIDEKKPPQRRLSALYGEEASLSPARVLPGEVRFSHQTHVVGNKIACGECHRGIEDSQAVSDRVRVFKDDCLRCHARAGRANDCEVCHREVRKDLKPESHLHNWKEFHGQAVRADSGKSVDRCSLCHAPSRCVSCHQDEAPRDHTNHWRQRGHGIAASIDRERCAPCHRSDFCDRCHRETPPRSHLGSWGSPRDFHCLTCHSPLSIEPCSICHRGTPSHALAAAKPAWHTPAMNCRQCHTGGAMLPHVDNGDNCNTCHR